MSTSVYKGNRNVKRFCCIDCVPDILAMKKAAVERVRLWRKKFKEKDPVLLRQYRTAEARKYRSENRGKVRAYKKSYDLKNRETVYKQTSDYVKKHPWINRNNASKRRAARLKRTPAWADLRAIKDFYRSCPEDRVVDHVIPLQGKTVSGLHVHYNLQYLSDSENSRKHNKYPYEPLS